MVDKFTIDMSILFLIFNRLDTTLKVFNRIKQVKPKKLYIASDGARTHINNEKELVEEIRAYVLENIDWECEIKTLFRNKNLGCKYAVSGAIQWFFSHEERGIILEDDIVPSLYFFTYCEDMLEKYKDDKRIGSISGRNDLGQFDFNKDASYYFSNKFICWGWASWADRILDNDVEYALETKVEDRIYKQVDLKEKLLLKGMIGLIKSKQVNSWAYPYDLSFRHKKQLCMIPSKNMVVNVGLDVPGTHSSGKSFDDAEYFEDFIPQYDKNIVIKANYSFMNAFIDKRYRNLPYLIAFSNIEYLSGFRKLLKKIKKLLKPSYKE